MNEESACSENLAVTTANTEEKECLRDHRNLFENLTTCCFCCFQGRGRERKKKKNEKNENHHLVTISQGDKNVNQEHLNNEQDYWHTGPLGEPGCGDATTPLYGKQGNTEVQDNVIAVHNSEETQMQEHPNLVPQHTERKKYKEEKQVRFDILHLTDSFEREQQEGLKHRSIELKGADHKEENYYHVPNKEGQQPLRPKYRSTLSLRVTYEKEQQEGQNHLSSKSDKAPVKKKEDYPSIQNSEQCLGPGPLKALALALTSEQEQLQEQNLININAGKAAYREDRGITKKEERKSERPEHPNTLYREQTYKKEKEKGQDHVSSESTSILPIEQQQYLGPEALNISFLSAIYDKKQQKRQKVEGFESDKAPYKENHELLSMEQQQSTRLEHFDVLSSGVTCKKNQEQQDYMSSKAQHALSNEEQDFSDVPKEEVHQCIEAENLSTFSLSLISETQNQEDDHVCSEPQDVHVEKEFNYESTSNIRVQRMEQEPNILPVEVICETEQRGQNQGSSELEEAFCKEKQNYHYVPHREAQQPIQPEYLSSLSQEITFQKEQELEGQDPVSSEILQKKVFEKVPNVEESQAVGAEHHNTSSLTRTCENEIQITKDYSNSKSLVDCEEHQQERQDHSGKMFFLSSDDEEMEQQDEYNDLIIMSQEVCEEEKDLPKTVSQGELCLEEQQKSQEPLNRMHLWVSEDTKEEQDLLHVLLEQENKQQDAQDSLSLRSPHTPCKKEEKVDEIQDVTNIAILCEPYEVKEQKEGTICEKTEDH